MKKIRNRYKQLLYTRVYFIVKTTTELDENICLQKPRPLWNTHSNENVNRISHQQYHVIIPLLLKQGRSSRLKDFFIVRYFIFNSENQTPVNCYS